MSRSPAISWSRNLARGREYSAMERSIDVQISRLRRMVEEDPAHPRYIQTVWGLGYVFVRTALKTVEADACATKFICPYVIAHRHLAVRQPGDDFIWWC
ncbi:winged helix-turn-helix domain-containing protein [Escherichia coli]